MKENNIKVGAFVIPNSSGLVGNFVVSSVATRVKAQMEEICAQFDMDFDPANDRLIQMWFHSDELGSDNLEAHGFDYGEDSYEFRYGYLPYKILKDVKEGDTLTIEFNCDKYEEVDDDHWKSRKVPLTMDVKFEQLPYRYRNKGRFEEAVRYVL